LKYLEERSRSIYWKETGVALANEGKVIASTQATERFGTSWRHFTDQNHF